MSFTQAQMIANTREMMDATSSSRWTDAVILTMLGIAGANEWSGILAANPTYRFAQRSVTASAAGLVAYTALNSGVADAAQTVYRLLSVTDGQSIYRQTTFQDVPVATTSAVGVGLDYQWYDAGSNFQILPVSAATLTVTINYTPPRLDQLAGTSSVFDFPADHECIVWLEAAATLLSKGGAENDAAQTMRAMADAERQSMYQDLSRRSARPLVLRFNDAASEWGGR